MLKVLTHLTRLTQSAIYVKRCNFQVKASNVLSEEVRKFVQQELLHQYVLSDKTAMVGNNKIFIEGGSLVN